MSPTAFVVAGALVGAFGLGHLLASTAGDARLDALRAQMSRSQAAQAKRAIQRLQDAQDRSDQLTAALHAANQVPQ